jgi:hypothetical protein
MEAYFESQAINMDVVGIVSFERPCVGVVDDTTKCLAKFNKDFALECIQG